MKLEIALAIPASNDEKYNSNNSAGQGLSDIAFHTLNAVLLQTMSLDPESITVYVEESKCDVFNSFCEIALIE